MLKNIAKKIIDSIIYFESLFVTKEKSADNKNKKRVLIFRKDTLGDFILFYPTLSAYRKKYCDSDITLVVTSLFQSLSPLLAGFENIIWFDAKRFSKSFLYRRNFLIDLKRKGFDTAIYTSFSREPMGDFMLKITSAPEKIGVDGDLTAIDQTQKYKGNLIYSKLVSVPESLLTELDKNVYIAENITGEKVTASFPTIDIKNLPSNEAIKIIKENNLDSRKYVIFFPGSGTTFKIWPTEKFAKIADYLISKNIVPVFCGSKSESVLIQNIISNMESKSGFIDLTGKTDLPTMAHLLKNSLFYFGSDTGITHLAAATVVPAICLLGGGHFLRFFPYGDLNKNIIVYDKNMSCKNDNWMCARNLPDGESAPCIKNIEVEDAKKEIDIMLTKL